MPFCGVCGAQMEGRFCAKCGSPVAGAPEAAPAGSGTGAPPPMATSAGMTENAASALCYLLGFITGIIFLVLEPYSKNRNIRFHAFQSIFLSVVWFIVRMALSFLLLNMFHLLSFLFLSSVVSLCFFALWLYMLIVTYQGKRVVLPIIGPLAEQQVH